MSARRGGAGAARVDWAAARRRVADMAEALAHGSTPSPERVRELLDERARSLARRPEAPANGVTLDVVTFLLARETYALDTRHVLEVFRLAELARLPGAEPPVFGLTTWRGELLTVLDLRPVLGLSAGALNDLGRVVVIGEGQAGFGILVDAVHGMTTIPVADVLPRAAGAPAGQPYLRGVTRDAVLVLDGSELLRLYA